MRSFGVDEAGKGPVLGPMVAACVVAEPAALPSGIDDSKRVEPPRREELAATLRATDGVTIGISHIGVDRIDDASTDMNSLTVAAHAEAIRAAEATGVSGLVDAGEVDADRFARRLRAACPDRSITITARHGADGTSALVGAASIVAKVERDRAIAAIAETYGDVGSGYPSDPTTREFLSDYVRMHGSLPACARRSWQTSADILAAAGQRSLTDGEYSSEN